MEHAAEGCFREFDKFSRDGTVGGTMAASWIHPG